VVTNEELELMIRYHPLLFHMAECESWVSIRQYGLLSTTALLDLYGYVGAERQAIEGRRRPESITIRHRSYGTAVVRDQKPMTDSNLSRALRDGLTPEDWYRLLNARVFFWLTEDRLHRLLNAGTYSRKTHDVLMVETRPLVENYRHQITLSPMNSGNTRPYPHKRGRNTFLSIADYPYREERRKRPREPVVELAVEGGVPDIAEYVTEVAEMQGNTRLRTIWKRS
jgi:hypothetical protein